MPADDTRPVFHYPETKAGSGPLFQTFAVIHNLKSSLVPVAGQADPHLGCPGVLDHVVQRLLGNAVEVARHMKITHQDRTGTFELALHAAKSTRALHKFGQANLQRIRLSAKGHQATSQKARLRDRFAEQTANEIGSLGESGVSDQIRFKRRAHQFERGELLP